MLKNFPKIKNFLRLFVAEQASDSKQLLFLVVEMLQFNLGLQRIPPLHALQTFFNVNEVSSIDSSFSLEENEEEDEVEDEG